MLFPRIRDLREDHDKKQLELANYLHVKPNTYSDYERGKINIQIDTLIKIADFYHVSLDYLVGRDDVPNRKKKNFSSQFFRPAAHTDSKCVEEMVWR